MSHIIIAAIMIVVALALFHAAGKLMQVPDSLPLWRFYAGGFAIGGGLVIGVDAIGFLKDEWPVIDNAGWVVVAVIAASVVASMWRSWRRSTEEGQR